jgi:hypothetical protein
MERKQRQAPLHHVHTLYEALVANPSKIITLEDMSDPNKNQVRVPFSLIGKNRRSIFLPRRELNTIVFEGMYVNPSIRKEMQTIEIVQEKIDYQFDKHQQGTKSPDARINKKRTVFETIKRLKTLGEKTEGNLKPKAKDIVSNKYKQITEEVREKVMEEKEVKSDKAFIIFLQEKSAMPKSAQENEKRTEQLKTTELVLTWMQQRLVQEDAYKDVELKCLTQDYSKMDDSNYSSKIYKPASRKPASQDKFYKSALQIIRKIKKKYANQLKFTPDIYVLGSITNRPSNLEELNATMEALIKISKEVHMVGLLELALPNNNDMSLSECIEYDLYMGNLDHKKIFITKEVERNKTYQILQKMLPFPEVQNT